MVVFLQVFITRFTRSYPALHVLRWGAVFYIAAPMILALSTGFWGFWLAMVVMTLGELVVVPRTSAYVANLAPAALRGRYLSLYGLTWNVAAGFSPALGGFLSDTLGPQAPWWGGALIGILAFCAFWTLRPAQIATRTDAA
jgi:MFS family permease